MKTVVMVMCMAGAALAQQRSKPQEPSATDRKQSAGDGSVWAIIGESGTTFWRDEEAGFVPLSYTVLER